MFGVNGSGMHVHQSLSGPRWEEPVLHEKDQFKLSPVARSFMAGQLTHARGMAAIVAPLVNSYKRLVPGYEAPVTSAGPAPPLGADPGCPASIPRSRRRREPSCAAGIPAPNPYLAFSVTCWPLGWTVSRRSSKLSEPPSRRTSTSSATRKMAKRSVGVLAPARCAEAIQETEKEASCWTRSVPHIASWFLQAKRQVVGRTTASK